MRGVTSVWVTVRFRRKSALKRARQRVRARSKVLTADNRGVFRLFVCLQLSVLSCRRVFTASGARTDDRQTRALPLRMTPPWPFSTSPHCASTEPCGDKRSLGGWKSPDAAGVSGARSSGSMAACVWKAWRNTHRKKSNCTCVYILHNNSKGHISISTNYLRVFLEKENINGPYFAASNARLFLNGQI